MKADKSREKAIAYLKRFKAQRKSLDFFRGDSDHSRLRRIEFASQGFILTFALGLFRAIDRPHFLKTSNWLDGWIPPVFFLIALAGFAYSACKTRKALALFEEAAPQDIDELLATIEPRGEFSSRPRPR